MFSVNKTVFIDFKSNPDFKSNEYPDGMTTDKCDKLWVSLYGGGRVVQIDQISGNHLFSIKTLNSFKIDFKVKSFDNMIETDIRKS